MPAERPPATSPSIGHKVDEWLTKHDKHDFVPVKCMKVTKASKFEGFKPGWVFKLGQLCLGYCRDYGGYRSHGVIGGGFDAAAASAAAAAPMDGAASTACAAIAAAHSALGGELNLELGRHPRRVLSLALRSLSGQGVAYHGRRQKMRAEPRAHRARGAPWRTRRPTASSTASSLETKAPSAGAALPPARSGAGSSLHPHYAATKEPSGGLAAQRSHRRPGVKRRTGRRARHRRPPHHPAEVLHCAQDKRCPYGTGGPRPRSAPRRLPLTIMTLAVSVPLASRMPKKNCSSNVALRANPQRHNGHHGGWRHDGRLLDER